VVECPALPGGVSQGADEKEALENIKEAITAGLWAEERKALPLSRINKPARRWLSRFRHGKVWQ